ncbi:hypothetical protein LIER_17549 [Lithospermum erythrorhizon]|uniref:Uncharacterized protein n=1 Tax=Lithospermum erythrorhizon TaxID=34254 RepID=A0AAV3QDA1_LITER
MDSSLEGVQTAEGIGDVIHGSDVGRELLLCYFSLSLKRTIQTVQAKLEEADHKVPSPLWDFVRDNISPSDLSDL